MVDAFANGTTVIVTFVVKNLKWSGKKKKQANHLSTEELCIARNVI